jgi:radical SAM superfamily enzyme YgiQ (UPF0313 family)
LYLAAALRRGGHEVQLADLMFSKAPQEDIRRAIETFSPTIIALSIRNLEVIVARERLFGSYLSECCRTIRRHSNAPLVLGGPGFSLFPRELMASLKADYGIVYEGELAFPLLLEALAQQTPLTDVPGLLWWDGEELRVTPEQCPKNLDHVPFQAIDLIDAAKYRRWRGHLGVVTKKGCAQRCTFCPEQAGPGHRVRLRSPLVVADEMDHLQRQTGLRYFDFADPLFNTHPAHAMEVLEELCRRQMGARFEVEVNPVGQNGTFADLLQGAGCIMANLTADSGSDEMLERLQKGYSRADILRVAGLYSDRRLPYMVGFLLGGPGERLETIEETIDLIERLPRVSTVYISVGLRIHPGAPLHQTALDEGQVDPGADLLTPRYYLSPHFDATCAQRLLELSRRSRTVFLSEAMYGTVALALRWLADQANSRPVTKYAAMAKIIEKIYHRGGAPVSWDERLRCFRPQ